MAFSKVLLELLDNAITRHGRVGIISRMSTHTLLTVFMAQLRCKA